jgi:hypothetical protein
VKNIACRKTGIDLNIAFLGLKHISDKAYYVGVLISLWLFLFEAQPKEFFFDGLKMLKQRSHKCVELRREYVNTFFYSRSLFSL